MQALPHRLAKLVTPTATLGATTLLVLTALRDRAEGDVIPGKALRSVASVLGVSRQTVHRAVRKLMTAGILQRPVPRGGYQLKGPHA